MTTATRIAFPTRSYAQELKSISAVVTWCLIGGAVFFMFWRCKYGVDLTDESAYLGMGFKAMPLGDRPFVDEIFVGPKNFYLLNNILVRPFLPFSVLALREAAVALYAIVLLALTWISFSGRPGLLGGLAFAACLLLDRFNMPTWSHNWWCRNLLLAHQAFLIASFLKPKFAKSLLFAGGVCFGVCLVAYNTLAVPWILCVAGLAYFMKKRESVIAYAMGGCAPVALYFLYLLKSGLLPDYLYALQATSLLRGYSKPFFSEKLVPVVSTLISKPWWALVIVAWLLPMKLGERRLRKALPWVLVVLFGMTLFSSDIVETMSLYTGLAVGSALLMFWAGRKEPRFYIMAIAGFSVIVVMGLSSYTGVAAFFWGCPLLIVPFVGASRKWAGKASLEQNPQAYAFVCFWLAVILVATIRYQCTTCYDDESPMSELTEVKAAPFTGLYTSARRAFLVDTLAKVAAKANFALVHMALPGTFMFGNVRSSLPFVFEDLDAPPSLQKEGLNSMLRRGRLPDLLILVKQHPWTWGGVASGMRYPREDPLLRYIECARQNVLVSIPEFDAYSVDATKARTCVSGPAGPLGENT